MSRRNSLIFAPVIFAQQPLPKPRRRTANQRPTVAQFLTGYPVRVRKLTLRLRRIVKTTMPELIEAVAPGWKLIGYRVVGLRSSKYFCYLAPMEDHVRLGFEYGRWLTDPSHILQGSGTQVRFVVIKNEKEIRVKVLQQLIAEASLIALTRSFASEPR